MTKPAARMLVLAFFTFCMLFGGASNAGFFVNALLQVGGSVLILIILQDGPTDQVQKQDWLNKLVFAVGLIAIFQFVPMPMSVWLSIPGRMEVAGELALLGVSPSPSLVTLLYHETIKSLVWAIPSLALLICLRRLERGWEFWAGVVIVCAAMIALAIGTIQFFGGKESPLYFYEVTNVGYLVGIFANANHMATLLLLAMPFLAASFRVQLDRRKATSTELGVLAALSAGFIAIGIALVGSLTGYALAAPVIIASCAILFPSVRRAAATVFLVTLGIGMVFFVSSEGADNAFEQELASSTGGREILFENTAEAIGDHFPLGTGLGTFQEVYTRYEATEDIDRTYANHAHNDYLEIVLELGLLGGALVLAFLIWWFARARVIWSDRVSDPLAKAAVVASGTLLIHSFWDYPLRTVTLSSIFAVCLVLMAQAIIREPGFAYKKPTKNGREIDLKASR